MSYNPFFIYVVTYKLNVFICLISKSDTKLNINYDWELVAEKKECGGSEINLSYHTTAATADIAMCAHLCKEKSTMFALGTNGFGSDSHDRCFEHGCSCLCETAAKPDGTCDIVSHAGFRLYRYTHRYTDIHKSKIKSI